MLHAASQSNLTDSVLGGSLLVCFEEAKYRRQRPAPSSALHLQQQQPIQHRAVRVTQPMRNSAPSRLQNLDDFYLDDFYLADGCYRVTKTRSLTDLFTQRERNADRRCCFTGGPTRGDAACPGPEIEPLQNVTGDMLPPSADGSDDEDDESDSAVVTAAEPSTWSFRATRDECDELITARVTDVLRDEPEVFERVDDVTVDDAEASAPAAAAVGGSISMCEVQLSLDVDVCQTRRHTLAEIRTADSNASSESPDDAPAMSSERVAAAERSWTAKTTTTSCHQSVARSYSEGSWKSKPETAPDGPRGRPKLRRRKSVHFADSKGLELEIKIPFCKELDEDITPPRLLEALQKIRAEMQGKNNKLTPPNSYAARAISNHISGFTLSPQFRQPFLEPSFQQRVSGQLVCLESIAVTPNSLSVTGVVRVVNIEFEKQVIVRYTTDGWRSHDDIPACFIGSLPECNQDQFSFHMVAPPSMTGGGQIQLAVQYRLQRTNREYWDNNFARNYVIKYLQHVTARSDDAMMT